MWKSLKLKSITPHAHPTPIPTWQAVIWKFFGIFFYYGKNMWLYLWYDPFSVSKEMVGINLFLEGCTTTISHLWSVRPGAWGTLAFLILYSYVEYNFFLDYKHVFILKRSCHKICTIFFCYKGFMHLLIFQLCSFSIALVI